MRVPAFFLVCIVLAFVGGTDLLAQNQDQCLTCHAEPSLSMAKKGRTVSLFIDAAAFKKSAHSSMECVACHEGFKPDDVPHAKRIRPVDCLSCHDGEKLARYKESIHGVMVHIEDRAQPVVVVSRREDVH